MTTTPAINTWTHPRTGQTRRYINNWRQVIGLHIERRRGSHDSVCNAVIDGEHLSNKDGSKLLDVKVWLDDNNQIRMNEWPELGWGRETITRDMVVERVAAAVAAM